MTKKPIDITIKLRISGLGRLHPGSRRGFTLTELLVVLAIIGIIVAFITKAGIDGVRRANEADTLSLIQKLDTAMSERMEALLSISIYPNAAHNILAMTYSPSVPGGTASPDRAQVIALYDFIKAELPDVFFFPSGDPNYPLNFAAQPWQATTALSNDSTGVYGPLTLPLGAGTVTAFDGSNPNGTGIFGASYTAAAGIYKNLGYHPKGYDGIDNDVPGATGYGLVDDWSEGVDDPSVAGGNFATVSGNLSKHTHKTARSEMLYAILVEGQGPLGSAFSPDDFTSRQVADTDGDGLPEFVDAWGEPLQFYRWPIFYHSDIQRGFPTIASNQIGPYAGPFDIREQDPLDPNLQLVSPSWMLSGQHVSGSINQYFNSGTDSNGVINGLLPLFQSGDTRLSAGAWLFQNYFHTLVEPISLLSDASNAANAGELWERTNNSAFVDYRLRRSYFTKFLIISSGPDTALGVGMLGVNYQATGEIADTSGSLVSVNATNLIQIENTAAAIDPNQWNPTVLVPEVDLNASGLSSNKPDGTTVYLQQNAGLDDISNHGAQSSAGSNP